MKNCIYIIFISFICFSCSNNKLEKHNQIINTFLEENIHQKKVLLKLDTISTFNWDEIIVVGPYVDLDDVSNKINYDFYDFPHTIKHHDSYVLIGFVKNKKGLKFIEINRYLISDNIYESKTVNYRIYPKFESNLLISR